MGILSVLYAFQEEASAQAKVSDLVRNGYDVRVPNIGTNDPLDGLTGNIVFDLSDFPEFPLPGVLSDPEPGDETIAVVVGGRPPSAASLPIVSDSTKVYVFRDPKVGEQDFIANKQLELEFDGYTVFAPAKGGPGLPLGAVNGATRALFFDASDFAQQPYAIPTQFYRPFVLRPTPGNQFLWIVIARKKL